MKNILLFITVLFFNSVLSQESLIVNKCLELELQNVDVDKDSLYVFNSYIGFAKPLKGLNKGTLEFWWKDNNQNNIPPLELLLDNINFDYMNKQINKSYSSLISNQVKINGKINYVNKDFIKRNRNKRYIYITKPIFNKSKKWAFIIKESFTPYTNTRSGSQLYIYVKSGRKWYLYDSITISYN